MIRVQYENGEDIRIRNLTTEQVVDAFIKKYSKKSRSRDNIIVDVYKGIDKTASEFGEFMIRLAIKDIDSKKKRTLVEMFEIILAPAKKLANAYHAVVAEYCVYLDKQ